MPLPPSKQQPAASPVPAGRKDKTSKPPQGMGERSAAWHLEKFTEFIAIKRRVGEPSPHLAIVGHMCKDAGMRDRLWLLGCYAATYCLPTAHVIWKQQPAGRLVKDPGRLRPWLTEHWKGVVTRQERRCVRTPAKMDECLRSYLRWMGEGFPTLSPAAGEDPKAFYDRVWASVSTIKFFGRYINIRLVEGLRRYCGVPASLYDIRSIGGWSPKKCLCYLYPQHADQLLIDDKAGNGLTDRLAYQLLGQVQKRVPETDCYILAAMLCEYKGAFEKHHQYPGWTLDQEPLLYDKVQAYWGGRLDSAALWSARAALFPPQVLGERQGWHGTRWPAAAVLRDYGYNWNDFTLDYAATERAGRFANPVKRKA